ncbi:MAG: M18 family aminopeptidase [Faecousia sp.]
MDHRIQAFCEYLDHSHSAYHAQANLVEILKEQGYTQLDEGARWALTPGGKYFVCRGGATVIAFRVPEQTPRGFLISAAHTDRPSFKLKENAEKTGAYTTVCVEHYGGALMFPWPDRPLSIAGRVLVETEQGAQAKLIDLDRDLLLIPNVAIHMNRQANEGYKWNPVMDMNPLVGSKNAQGKLSALLEQEAGGKILGHDLYLYIREKASVWGLEDEFISAQALDDLQSVWGCFQGFLNAAGSEDIPVFCALNSEEIGSRTQNGADSTVLEDTLVRIAQGLNLEVRRLLAQSFLVSADNAHAIHPNHPELADPANAPVMGQGVVLKFNANQRYCTDGLCAAVFRKVCRKAGVPVQTYYNRPDIPGGSTLGCVSISHVSVPTADIGLPQLAMHSCYETASVADTLSLMDAMKAYYESTLELDEDGFVLK